MQDAGQESISCAIKYCEPISPSLNQHVTSTHVLISNSYLLWWFSHWQRHSAAEHKVGSLIPCHYGNILKEGQDVKTIAYLD